MVRPISHTNTRRVPHEFISLLACLTSLFLTFASMCQHLVIKALAKRVFICTYPEVSMDSYILTALGACCSCVESIKNEKCVLGKMKGFSHRIFTLFTDKQVKICAFFVNDNFERPGRIKVNALRNRGIVFLIFYHSHLQYATPRSLHPMD